MYLCVLILLLDLWSVDVGAGNVTSSTDAVKEKAEITGASENGKCHSFPDFD